MFYLDTSFIAPAFVHEAQSEACLDWLAAKAAGSLYASAWVQTEFASAVARKRRQREIRPSHAAAALTGFNDWLGNSCVLLPVEVIDFERAAAMIGQPGVSLRAGDALHLAVVERGHLALKSYDSGLLRAARLLGISIAD